MDKPGRRVDPEEQIDYARLALAQLRRLNGLPGQAEVIAQTESDLADLEERHTRGALAPV